MYLYLSLDGTKRNREGIDFSEEDDDSQKYILMFFNDDYAEKLKFISVVRGGKYVSS
jgi:hypothetical protein